jgi:AbrB family looped-hinge helix DNA binding protein
MVGSLAPMEVTVDKVGRVVIPKQLRTAFGIGPDSKLTIHEDGVGIRMEPVVSRERRIEERDGFLVLLAPEGDHEPVTDEVINRLRDAMQR